MSGYFPLESSSRHSQRERERGDGQGCDMSQSGLLASSGAHSTVRAYLAIALRPSTPWEAGQRSGWEPWLWSDCLPPALARVEPRGSHQSLSLEVLTRPRHISGDRWDDVTSPAVGANRAWHEVSTHKMSAACLLHKLLSQTEGLVRISESSYRV